tara:strand:- start:760 stop:1629 length:870 start_codon:yes stop_codon:yes gene_type:complete
MFDTSTKELFLWIQNIQKEKRNLDSFYLLLDLLGGISKTNLNLSRIQNRETIQLKVDINILKSKWLEHINYNVPIQYICGSSYWRDIKLNLSNQVLIPRVETEQVIDIVLGIFHNFNEEITFADLGTGSGAIAIALSLVNKKWKGLATDIDSNALFIAKKNYLNISNNSNLSFFCGSWWQPLIDYEGMIDIVISNPPYIPKDTYKKLPTSVKDFEPMIALLGGDDGLFHIKKIISGAPKFLKKGGWIIIENHFDQSQKVKNLMKGSGFDSIKTINDLFGIGRFTIGRYK